MPKVLCMTGMAIAALILLLFLFDLLVGVIGYEAIAPFRSASKLMDILFIIGSAILGYLSWSTFKEQI